MPPPSPLSSRLSRAGRLGARELQLLAALEQPIRKLAAQQWLLDEGDPEPPCAIVHAGWAAGFKLLADGRRQILGFALPGDMVGLASFPGAADHAAVALTPLQISRLAQAQLFELFGEAPVLARALLRLAAEERARLAERLVSLGRRSALERIAHLFLELHQRLAVVGLTEANRFVCPLTQEDVGDALGLTGVHVNRVLRDLRERGLLTFARHEATLHDPEGLAQLADFPAATPD
jgi:CRP-like cAMP-binding protein